MTTTTLKRMCVQLCAAMLAFAPLQAQAQEAPAQPSKQRPGCADGIAMRAAAALGHRKADDFGMACKPMPSNPARSIVALYYVNGAQDENGGDYVPP